MTISCLGKGFVGGVYKDEAGNLLVNYAFQYVSDELVCGAEVAVDFSPSTDLSALKDAIHQAIIDYMLATYEINVESYDIIIGELSKEQL